VGPRTHPFAAAKSDKLAMRPFAELLKTPTFVKNQNVKLTVSCIRRRYVQVLSVADEPARRAASRR